MYQEKGFTVCDKCRVAEILHSLRRTLPFNSYSLSHATIEANGMTLPHRLTKASERYVILEGKLFINAATRDLKKASAPQFRQGQGSTSKQRAKSSLNFSA